MAQQEEGTGRSGTWVPGRVLHLTGIATKRYLALQTLNECYRPECKDCILELTARPRFPTPHKLSWEPTASPGWRDSRSSQADGYKYFAHPPETPCPSHDNALPLRIPVTIKGETHPSQLRIKHDRAVWRLGYVHVTVPRLPVAVAE